MAVIDPTTPIGKVRLRVGDYRDLPIMPDSVYQMTLDENDGNVPRSAMMMAQYILGALSMSVHEKMAQLEVYGNQLVDNYIKFLNNTVLNPNFMTSCPMPYGAGLDEDNAILQFQEDWNKCYYQGTDSQQLHFLADLSPNNPYGDLYNGFV